MGRRNRRQQNNSNGNRANYVISSKENDLFEKYYKIQKIMPDEEFESFLSFLRKPLPTTFRITSFKSHSTDVLSFVKEKYFASLVNKLSNSYVRTSTEEPVIDQNNSSLLESDEKWDCESTSQNETIKCLSWYPNEMAWQLNLDRKNIRQNTSLKSLHQFLVQETESGNISRQEAVSMLPPMVLNVQSNSKVLDMCAAPGSKTVQLIEYLHANSPDPKVSSPEGFVIANDSDNRRCYLMIHQINRLSSPNYAVTNMDASILPNFFWDGGMVKFDKILCDVPCTGDGTLRKNVDAWEKWNPGAAHGLHNLQKRILKRGLEMLAEGGELVYSTCSFNPIENEAVVANVLIENKALELVDLSEALKNLKWRPGLSTWKVMTKKEELFDDYHSVPARLQTQINESIFPPSADVFDELKLHRCVRILPHDQNTGGFFLALLRKKNISVILKEVTATINSPDTIGENNGDDLKISNENNKRKLTSQDNSNNFKKVKHFGYKEDPFIFLKDDDEIWNPIREFYGISSEFPFSQLMVRCETGKKRNIYFVSPIIKKLVQSNEARFKFINFGVKILSRSEHKDSDCQFRLVQDAIHILHPYVSKRVITIRREDVIILLTSENPYINRLSKSAGDQINQLGQGGCIYVCNDLIRDGDEGRRIILCGWKGKVSCRSFLPKNDREHVLRLCGYIPAEKPLEKLQTNQIESIGCDNTLDKAEVLNDNIAGPLINDDMEYQLADIKGDIDEDDDNRNTEMDNSTET